MSYRDFQFGNVLQSLTDISKSADNAQSAPALRVADDLKRSLRWYLGLA